MKTLITSHIFNLTDVTVIVTVIFILTLMILFVKNAKRVKALEIYFLSIFLFFNALYSLNNLVFWNDNIRPGFLSASPDIYFILALGIFIQGPMLYLFVRKSLYIDFSIKWVTGFHFVPVVFFLIYLYCVFLRHDYSVRLAYLEDWSSVFDNVFLSVLIWSQRLSIFIYSMASYFLLHRYLEYIKANNIEVDARVLSFYKVLVVGTLVLCGWIIVSLLQALTPIVNLDSFMGVAENYIRLGLFSFLLALVLRCSIDDIYIPGHLKIRPVSFYEDVDLKRRISVLMDETQPFRDPLLTQVRLAELLGLSPRRLSRVIHQHFNQSFWRFVSSYRVRLAAQHLACSTDSANSILDIMKSCGFNSKSSFNSAFKREYGVSPSNFRRSNRNF
ncbi:MAG: AraC-like DNA-binding protein [Flavobacteriales bacterium]|jgi:AraC-like DNA-binding protein